MEKTFTLAFPVLMTTIYLASPILAASQARPPHALTASQKSAMEAIKVEAEKKSAPVAVRFADVVKRIYENMLADRPDEELRNKLDSDMKNAAWELLDIKGRSIRDTVNLLNEEQKKILRNEMAKPGAPSDLTELIVRLF